MSSDNGAPLCSYGVLLQNVSDTAFDEAVEQVRCRGYAVLDSGYTKRDIQRISDEFNSTRKHYIELHGEDSLRQIDELHTVRSPLTHGGGEFLALALNDNLLTLVKKLIIGKFILNQQNGVSNPPQEGYNQGAWHRDLPYQHFVSTSPLAINALFCVDDFTIDNGATFVLPASHKSEAFPSESYIKKNAIQVEAKAGSFIVLDCMIFHAGGYNKTNLERRAINHIYNIPYFKQQINIPMNISGKKLSVVEKDILGFNYAEPNTVSDYLSLRSVNKI